MITAKERVALGYAPGPWFRLALAATKHAKTLDEALALVAAMVPHGAGRNTSRTAHIKRQEGRLYADMLAEEAPDLDIRFFCGTPDVSELPSAYKDALDVRNQIKRFGLTNIVDQIDPFGCIMAGDWQKDAPWKNKKKVSS